MKSTKFKIKVPQRISRSSNREYTLRLYLSYLIRDYIFLVLSFLLNARLYLSCFIFPTQYEIISFLFYLSNSIRDLSCLIFSAQQRDYISLLFYISYSTRYYIFFVLSFLLNKRLYLSCSIRDYIFLVLSFLLNTRLYISYFIFPTQY